MVRSIHILQLLSGSRTYDTKEIMARFGMSERTVYRVLNRIEDSGFVLERKGGRYRLAQDSSETRRLHKLFHFSEEEAFLLHHSLSQFELSNNAVKKLIRKLHALYDFQALARLKKDVNVEKVRCLARAMRNKNPVRLLNYRSSHSSSEGDRVVEAFEFMADFESVWCVDLEDKTVKQFKIARMEDVEVLTAGWSCEYLHKLPFVDAFRMTAVEPIAVVKAVLSLKAYNLLREEFPLASSHLKKEGKRYLLTIPIADYHGIGRFVLGLPGDIQVLEPVDFKDFLRKMREKYFD